jgi:hypothetical protein
VNYETLKSRFQVARCQQGGGVEQLRPVAVEDVNHYTILLSDHGAKAVALAVIEATEDL